LIGTVGAVVLLWFYLKVWKKDRAAGDTAKNQDTMDLDAVFREAVSRLKSSNLSRGASLNNLPVVFLIGHLESGKTSNMTHSGLEADFLAGQLYGKNQTAPIPTRSANIWYA